MLHRSDQLDSNNQPKSHSKENRRFKSLHFTSEQGCSCNDLSLTMVVKIRSVLFGAFSKIFRPCSTSPACEHALRTHMKDDSLIDSVGVRRNSSIASSPIPFSPYELTRDDQRDVHQTYSRQGEKLTHRCVADMIRSSYRPENVLCSIRITEFPLVISV